VEVTLDANSLAVELDGEPLNIFAAQSPTAFVVERVKVIFVSPFSGAGRCGGSRRVAQTRVAPGDYPEDRLIVLLLLGSRATRRDLPLDAARLDLQRVEVDSVVFVGVRTDEHAAEAVLGLVEEHRRTWSA
jgi:hypothetical protein